MAGSQDKITYEDLQTYHEATKPVEWQASTTYYKDHKYRRRYRRVR